jgi:hypothetical protein
VIVENASRSAAVMRNAPSRSCKEAVVTTTASSSPPVSTATCRLRPLIFFPPLYPLLVVGTVSAARTPLGVDHGRGRHGATPVGQRGTFTQRCVDPAPRPRADLHLFQAKREGRNRIVFDGAEAPEPAGDRQLSMYE